MQMCEDNVSKTALPVDFTGVRLFPAVTVYYVTLHGDHLSIVCVEGDTVTQKHKHSSIALKLLHKHRHILRM